MKKILVVSGLLAAMVAGAENPPSLNDLWQQAAREAKWEQVRLDVPNLTGGSVTAYRTDSGTFRLDSVSGTFQAPARIESGEFAKYSGLDQYLTSCRATEKAYPAYRSISGAYQLRLQIFPERNNGLSYIAHGSSGDWNVAQLDTNFLQPKVFRVHLVADSNAMIRQTLDQPLSAYERILTMQVYQQADQLAQGQTEIVLDLSHHEDVVCDILSGNVKIEVDAQVRYSKAKLDHQTRIFSDQMSGLYADIKDRWSSKRNRDRNVFYGALTLGRVATQLRVAPALADEELERLHEIFFRAEDGELKNFSNAEAAALSPQMDILSPTSTMSQPVYDLNVGTPSFGGGQ